MRLLMGGRRVPAALALLWLAGGLAQGAPAPEPPPAQGMRLHFRKTLFIHNSPLGRVVAETRRSEKESSLADILAADYGVSKDALPQLQQAFRELNRGVDSSRIPAGRTVKIPFKIEEGVARPTAAASAPPPPPSASPESYTVRAGDSLWRILKKRYRVSREAMSAAVAAVARANPGVRDVNRLTAGQTLVIPAAGAPAAEAPPPAAPSRRPAISGLSRSVQELLSDLGCRISSSGEAFVPVARGRTLRLDSFDNPFIVSPSGRTVILDPSSTLDATLIRSLESAWNYKVIQGAESNEEAFLEKILPNLGFFEASEGRKKATLARGVDLLADARWTVTPQEKDLWEGRIHFLFPAGSTVRSDLSAYAVRSGYSVHVLGGGSASVGTAKPLPPPKVAEISMSDAAQGESTLLQALGVPHRVRPDLECDLGGGVLYRLRPEITFEHGGTAYAVPPPEPRRAEALLTKAGYFTIPLADSSTPLNRLGDLLALLRRAPRHTVLEVPQGQSLRLRVEGLSVEAPGVPARLYASSSVRDGTKLLLTTADISPQVAAILLGEGFAPWVVRAPEPTSKPRR